MPNRTNRIEVDLKLLQDRNIDKLQEFGKQFDKSIDKLALLVGDWSQQVAGAASVAEQAGKIGPDASVSSNVRIDSPPARLGGVSTTSGFSGGFSTGFANRGIAYGEGGGPSVATPTPTGEENPGAFEQQYARAFRRLGENVPVGLRQALGYAAEGQFTIPGISRARAQRYNNWLFQGEAYAANARLGFGKLQNVFSGLQAPIVLGQSLGASRGGGVLGGVGSSAFWRGLSENFDTLRTADFGFNPAYSIGQAREARQVLESYGYSGDTSNMLADRLKQLQVHYGVDPTTAMTLLDPLMRFGGVQSFTQLNNILGAMPAAAEAARMNLQQFTQQIVSTAQQVAQSTGMPVGVATSSLTAFSAATGLNPSLGASFLENSQNVALAVGMTGAHITDLYEGNNTMAPRMAFAMRMFQNTVGMPIQNIAKLKQTDPAQYKDVMDRAYWLYTYNKDIFGGLSPQQILQMYTRNQGRPLQHMSITQQIEGLSTVGGTAKVAPEIEALLGQWGGTDGTNILSRYHKMLDQYQKTHPGTTESPSKLIADAIAAIGKQQNLASRRAAQRFTIELSGDAKKYFKIVSGGDTANRNSGFSFERSAMDVVNFGIHDVLPHLLP